MECVRGSDSGGADTSAQVTASTCGLQAALMLITSDSPCNLSCGDGELGGLLGVVNDNQ